MNGLQDSLQPETTNRDRQTDKQTRRSCFLAKGLWKGKLGKDPEGDSSPIPTQDSEAANLPQQQSAAAGSTQTQTAVSQIHHRGARSQTHTWGNIQPICP